MESPQPSLLGDTFVGPGPVVPEAAAAESTAKRAEHWNRILYANVVLFWFLAVYFLMNIQWLPYMSFSWITWSNTGSKHHVVSDLYARNRNPEEAAISRVWATASDYAGCVPLSDTANGVWDVKAISPLCGCLVDNHELYATNMSVRTAADLSEDFRYKYSAAVDDCFWARRPTQTASLSRDENFNVAFMLVLWNAMSCVHAFFCGLDRMDATNAHGTQRAGYAFLLTLPIFVVTGVAVHSVLISLIILAFYAFFALFFYQVWYMVTTDDVPRGLRQSYVFWPLFLVALITGLLTLNEVNMRRNSLYNASHIVVAASVACVLCAVDALDYYVRAEGKAKRPANKVWRHTIVVLVLINLIQSSSSSEVLSSNRASGAYLTLILLLFIPFLYKLVAKDPAGDEYLGLSYARACVELPARAILTITVCADMHGLQRQDRY